MSTGSLNSVAGFSIYSWLFVSIGDRCPRISAWIHESCPWCVSRKRRVLQAALEAELTCCYLFTQPLNAESRKASLPQTWTVLDCIQRAGHRQQQMEAPGGFHELSHSGGWAKGHHINVRRVFVEAKFWFQAAQVLNVFIVRIWLCKRGPARSIQWNELQVKWVDWSRSCPNAEVLQESY